MRELAERAVKAKHWRWMVGMRALDSSGEEHPARVIDHRRSVVYEDNDGALHEGMLSRPDVPDLSDPATLGCVMALVREAHGNKVVITQGNVWWSVETDHYFWDQDNTISFQGALVKALEAAP
jgi:hypothetical protein